VNQWAGIRLRSQRLTSAPLRTPADAVAWLGAMQSQEYAVAKWSIGLRSRNAVDADVELAYADGEILRTHVLRPTWHFVAREDIRWMLDLTAPRIHAQLAGRRRQLELDAGLVTKATRVVTRALENGTHRTRAQLQQILEAERIELKNERLGHVMMLLELDGLVCSGRPAGRQHTHALLHEHAPNAQTRDRDDALAELARRYLQGHGPASEKDLARWATLTLSDVRRALDILGKDVECLSANGKSWYRIRPTPRSSPNAPRAMLLQIYDEYVGGYGETRHVVDPFDVMHQNPAFRVSFMHVVVLDGHVIGHWRPAAKKAGGSVELQLARRLDRRDRDEVEAAVARYRAFVTG